MSKKLGAIITLIVIIIVAGSFLYLTMGNNGNLVIKVADQPSFGIKGVYITFSGLALHGNKTGWAFYNMSTPITINILGLTTSNASLLENITLTSQKYTMMRLYISKVQVNIMGMGNLTFNLTAPFAFLNHPINVISHKTVVVILDFNIQQDLNMNSRMFTPYIGNLIIQ